MGPNLPFLNQNQPRCRKYRRASANWPLLYVLRRLLGFGPSDFGTDWSGGFNRYISHLLVPYVGATNEAPFCTNLRPESRLR
jgi:hypothetical protein